jgi:hypothetical protein
MGRTHRKEKRENPPKKKQSYVKRSKAKKILKDWEDEDWENLSSDSIGDSNGSRNDGKR